MSLLLAYHHTPLITCNQQTELCLKALNVTGGWRGGTSPGRVQAKDWIGPCLCHCSWAKSVTPSAGFRGCGIFTFNPAQIKASLFAPSETTERAFQQTTEHLEEDTLLPGPSTSCHLGFHSRQVMVDISPHPLHLQIKLHPGLCPPIL